MSKVLIDNMTLYGVVDYSRNIIAPHCDQCWENFLMAIILWDELNYINYNSTGQSIVDYISAEIGEEQSLEKTIFPVDNKNIINDCISRGYIHPPYLSLLPIEIRETVECSVLKDDEDALRVQAYYVQSSVLGTNCLLHPTRNADELLIKLNRYHIMESADNQVREIINDINSRLGSNFLEFKYPILYKYIKRNTSSKTEELQAAFKIRNDKNVIKFRKSLNKLDKHINDIDPLPIFVTLGLIEEIAETIKNSFDTKITIGSFNILPKPNITVGGKIDISLKKKPIHLTFLKRVMKNGLTGK